MPVLVPLPAGQPSRTLLPPTDPASGIVTFTARPTRHAWAIGQDLLAALGIDHDLNGSGRRHGEDLEYARAWLTAYETRLLVIRHADTITSPDILDDLSHLCASVGAGLVLTCDDTGGEHLADWVTARDGTISEHAALKTLIAEAARSLPAMPSDAAPDYPRYLPRVEFYAFRSRVRDVLRPEQFTLVDRLYRNTFTAIADDPPESEEQAATALTTLIAQHRTPGEALTIARAAQAALFTRGMLLKVNVDTLLHGVAAAEHRRMTPAEVRSLRAYRTCWRSAAAVLYDANLSKEDLHALRIDQISDDGTPTVPHSPMLPDALLYLNAQRAYRLHTGSDPADPLIAESRAHVTYALRRIGAELNLPAPTNHVPAEAKKADRWQNRLGVALLPLVGSALPTSEPDQQTPEVAA
ncbi:hypothetical protein [Blastococcus sp. LR1]|uniref:hypothetical protein n=1 Tax=Blastococcus sp. LR1 TaxID=2877000 RepID=UPI001CCB2DAD|nr:hypothetical protein [Blastococcus sp. LR1]MCA0146658.1 hypothetical protein [Blastococcus sp. LR1]